MKTYGIKDALTSFTTLMSICMYRAYTKMSAIGAWENTKRATVEAQLKQVEVHEFPSYV